MLRSVASDGKFYRLPPDKENTAGSQHQIKVSYPSPHVSVFVWNQRFIFSVRPILHTYQVETVTKNTSFQKRSPGRETFENSVLVWMDENRGSFWKRLRRVVGYQKVRMLPTRIIWKGRKSLRFSKISGYVWPLSSQPVCIILVAPEEPRQRFRLESEFERTRGGNS